jgi:hypothetical protein
MMTLREEALFAFRKLREQMPKQRMTPGEIATVDAKRVAGNNVEELFALVRLMPVPVRRCKHNGYSNMGFTTDQIDNAIARIAPRRDRFYKGSWL